MDEMTPHLVLIKSPTQYRIFTSVYFCIQLCTSRLRSLTYWKRHGNAMVAVNVTLSAWGLSLYVRI